MDDEAAVAGGGDLAPLDPVEPGRRGPAPRAVLVLVLAVLALAVGIGLARRDDDGGSSTAAGTTDPTALSGTDWLVDSVSADGHTTDPPADRPATIRFAESSASGKSCNQFGIRAVVHAGTVTFGGDGPEDAALTSTAMGCSGPSNDVEMGMVQLLSGQTATWSVDGDRLRLEGNGVVLVAHLAGRDEAFPTPIEQLAVSESGALPQWQYGYTSDGGGYGLVLEWREEAGADFGTEAVGLSAGSTLQWEVLGGALFPYGTLPDGTAYVEFVPAEDGVPTSGLTIFTLPSGRLVFGQPVEGSSGVIQAYSDDDRLLEASRRIGV